MHSATPDRQAFREPLTGPVASVQIPFHPDGRIDFDALRNYVDFVIAGGTKTLLLTYGDSLYTVLTEHEIAEVTRVVADHTKGRALVVAADGMWATPKELEFARFVRDVGADMLMVLPPDWAESCTVETVVEHYAAVTEVIPVMVVTNYFMFRAKDFGLNVLERLRDRVPGVVAVKDDVCGEFARKMGLLLYGELALISGGQKQNHLNALPYGCDGYLSTFIKFKPEVAQAYWRAIQADDLETAREIIADYDIPLFEFIHAFPGGFNACIHGALELFGIGPRWRRKPYYSLNDDEMTRLKGFFEEKQLI